MKKIRFELQAEAPNGTWDTWDYEYTKQDALNWFEEVTNRYPNDKFRVIKCKMKIIADCKTIPEIK